MSILNYDKCESCGNEILFFDKICSNCNHLQKDKVPNIDFWKIIYYVFLEPKEFLLTVVLADHKNYISLVFFLFTVKFFILLNQVQATIGFVFEKFLYEYLIVFIVCLFLTGIWALIALNVFSNVKLRFKDWFSIIVFVNFPIVLSLLVFILEFSVFGMHFYNFNFELLNSVDSLLLYFFLFTEIVLFLWSFYLLYYFSKLLFRFFWIRLVFVVLSIVFTHYFTIILANNIMLAIWN